MSQDAVDAQIRIVQRITEIFRFDRYLYLFVNMVAVIILVSALGVYVFRNVNNLDSAIVVMLVGPSGVIGVMAWRLLAMWEKVLDKLLSTVSAPTAGDGHDNAHGN